jgi:hypothetical protein
MRTTVLGILAAVSTTTGLLSVSTPASAQLYNFGGRPSHTFTPSHSNIQYGVYKPRPQSRGLGFDGPGNSRRNSSRGYGHSSGSYFGW